MRVGFDEHALRIRLKSDSMKPKKQTSQANPGVSTSTTASSNPQDAEAEESAPEGGHVKQESANLIGKINNLITTDLSKIGQAHEVLSIRK